jgi:hypothetical protein
LARGRRETYELTQGAASQPLRSPYVRREPEKTVLHQVVRENLQTFLFELREDGHGLPRYVEEEFHRFLSCGLLSAGFCRVECPDCQEESVVAFSCRGRAFCLSCLGRRMSDSSAHLVDRVLPVAPYRQWVLAYPRKLRLALARDASAASEATSLFLREVFRLQRRRAREAGIAKPEVGAVAAIQRFGSRLDLNYHVHSVLPDGAFSFTDDGVLRFTELARPAAQDLEQVLERIAKKTLSMLRRRGLLEDEPSDALARVQAEAIQTELCLAPEPPRGAGKLSAFLEGFSLEAGAHVHAHDREGLEHLLRYLFRPPFSNDRLRFAADGRVELVLRRPMHDGQRVIAFTPVKFLRRLAAIVPPPRFHTTRYFGVFAPASKLRPLLVHGRPGHPDRRCRCSDCRAPKPAPKDSRQLSLLDRLPPPPLLYDPLTFAPPPFPDRPRRLDWASLLQRVFAIDVLDCPKCHGRRKVKAFVQDPEAAAEILERLGIDATAPPLAKARCRPRQEEFDLPAEDSGAQERYPDSP